MSRKRIKSKKKNKIFAIEPLVIVLGDGKTEEDYFERLNKINYFKDIRIKYEKGSEDNFETKLKEHLYIKDKVFVVLDIDNEDKSSDRYDKIKYLLEKYPNQVFYNNYAFEIWLINHKSTYGKPITNKEQYDCDIKSLFGVESWSSNKNKQNRTKIMSQIETVDVDCACKNIKVISANEWNNNPSSSMDNLIYKIDEIKE